MKVYEKQQTLESAEYSLEATTNWAVQEEMQSKAQIKSSNRKVDQWLREGGPGREICNINFMLPATKVQSCPSPSFFTLFLSSHHNRPFRSPGR